jgi:hypothetical protein
VVRLKSAKSYENFPVWIPLLANLVSISIYALGAAILVRFSVWAAAAYLLYCLWVEATVLMRSCVNCYYYGKVCGLGKGKLCFLLRRRGDPQEFASKDVTWLSMLPDFLVFLVPAVSGIILLVKSFSWQLLAIVAALFVLSLGGNALVRGTFACKYCKQREIGCPAEKLFGGKQTSGHQA